MELTKEQQNYVEDMRNAASVFSKRLREIENTSGLRANFVWKYDPNGRKFLDVADAALLAKLPADYEAQVAEEIPTIIEKAGELVFDGSASNGDLNFDEFKRDTIVNQVKGLGIPSDQLMGSSVSAAAVRVQEESRRARDILKCETHSISDLAKFNDDESRN